MTINEDSRVREAFDRHEASYDQRFSRNPLAWGLRQRTWEVLDSLFPAGSRVVDLGCGTGEDMLHLVSRGVSVCAVDLSERMIRSAEKKMERCGLGHRAECRVVDYTKLADSPATDRFDGLYSNFGALNCVPALDWLPGMAERWLKPGAKLVLVLMSPFYPLEFGVNLVRGRLWAAVRRWRGVTVARIEGVEFRVYYHSLRTLRGALGPGFVFERSEALGLLTPVPGLDHLDDRWGGILRRTRGLELWLSKKWPWSLSGDHYISVWRYEGR